MFKDIYNLWKDYREHRARDRALQELRLHTNKQLRDMGLFRGNLYEMSHSNCSFCKRFNGSQHGDDEDLW